MTEPKGVLRPFIRMLAGRWGWAAAGTLFGWLALTATVGLLAISGWFLSAAAHAGLTTATAQAFNYFFPSMGVRAFAVTRTVARYADRIFSHDATLRLLESLRNWFYDRIEPLAPGRLMQYRSGDILNRIVADIDALDNLYLKVLSPSVIAAVMALAMFVFLRRFDPVISFLLLAGLTCAGVGVSAAAGAAGGAAGRQQARLTARLRTRLVEGLQGLAELLVFGRQSEYLDDLQRDDRHLLATQRRMSRIRGAAGAAIVFIAGMAVLAILYRGSALVNRGALNGANLAMIVLAALAAFDAVKPLPSAYQHLGRTREAARRLQEVVETEPAVRFPLQSSVDIQTYSLRFDQVSFRYREGDPWAVTNVDFEVPEGRRAVVIGPTGAGKSTLAHLLTRFWDPTEGSVRIGGRDIRHLSEGDLRRSVCLVSQQAHLFNASLKDNLKLARPDAAEEDLWEALEAAQLADFVASAPQGLDTWIGEAGRRISGGQARRLAVARAVLRNAPVWILDEPTEGLDRDTEHRLMDSLLTVTRGRTVLLITHRLVDLEFMDLILVMERGRILECGTHADLMRRRTRYAELQARIWI